MRARSQASANAKGSVAAVATPPINKESEMATIMVRYPAHDGAKFDADYYAKTHIPLVEKAWGPHGLTGAEILFPHGEQPDVAMVLLRFRDQAAIDAAVSDTAAGRGRVVAFIGEPGIGKSLLLDEVAARA